MRVVNIDDIKKFYNEEFPELDDGIHWSRNDIIMNLDNIPTADAIPVEWIEGKIAMYDDMQMIGGMWGEIYGDLAHFLREIVNKWEKENGRSE